MLVADTARTPNSRAPFVPWPGLGLRTTVQSAPSQCSMSVRTGSRVKPTAHASHADSTVTPSTVLVPEPGLGGWLPTQLWQDAAAAAGTVTVPARATGPASSSAGPASRASSLAGLFTDGLFHRCTGCRTGRREAAAPRRPP